MTEIEHAPATPPTTTAHILYALHLVSPFTAWLLAVVAIVIGMATRDAVRGTWVDTHYSWLSRTFWFGLLWIVILAALTVVMILTVILIPLAWLLWTILFLWYLYRVIRGWVLLNDRKPAPL